jgi:hypothetical protein
MNRDVGTFDSESEMVSESDGGTERVNASRQWVRAMEVLREIVIGFDISHESERFDKRKFKKIKIKIK